MSPRWRDSAPEAPGRWRRREVDVDFLDELQARGLVHQIAEHDTELLLGRRDIGWGLGQLRHDHNLAETHSGRRREIRESL